MSALSTEVTFLVLVWFLTLGFFLFTFAVLAASCFGGLGFQESVSGASSCLFCVNELLKDFFQCHVLIFSPSKSNWMSWSARPRVKTSRIMCSVWSTFLSQFWHVVALTSEAGPEVPNRLIAVVLHIM